MLDTASNALVGLELNDTEDEQAVIRAFDHGTFTTDAPPIALTLDNRPSNLTQRVEASIQPAILLPATPGRGQAKAALEGSFGLFQQTAPPLDIRGTTMRELARSCLSLVVTIWAWARNGKPRARLGGRSPREVYLQDQPSDEQRGAAMEWILELRRRADLARLTRDALADPIRRQLLELGLAQLGIPDPDGRIATGLARYSMDAITRGLATFEARREQDTLPRDLDPADHHRFLGGIIRNLDTRYELERTAELLLAQRIRARDLTLEPLRSQAQQVRTDTPAPERPQAFVDRALAAERLIDFRFWSRTACEALAELTPAAVRDLYRPLAHRIAASFKTDRERRGDLLDRLATIAAS